MLNLTEAWKRAYPGALQGLLVMREVANPEHHLALEQHKAELEGWNKFNLITPGRSIRP